TAAGRLMVRGTTADNGAVRRVVVNGQEARPRAANFAEWEVALEPGRAKATQLTAHAEDAAGNVEPRPHVVLVNAAQERSPPRRKKIDAPALLAPTNRWQELSGGTR